MKRYGTLGNALFAVADCAFLLALALFLAALFAPDIHPAPVPKPKTYRPASIAGQYDWQGPGGWHGLYAATLHADGRYESVHADEVGRRPPRWTGTWEVKGGKLVIVEWPAGSEGVGPFTWTFKLKEGAMTDDFDYHTITRR